MFEFSSHAPNWEVMLDITIMVVEHIHKGAEVAYFERKWKQLLPA